MGWNSMVSLVVLGRQTSFLIVVFFLAILFAGVLVFFEFHLKHKKHIKRKKSESELFIQKIDSYKTLSKTPLEKLRLLDISAKGYIKKHFPISVLKGYTHLAEEFERIREDDFSRFSKKMVENYYGSKKINDEDISKTIDLFLNGVKKRAEKERPIVKKTVMEKVDSFVEHRREAIILKRMQKKLLLQKKRNTSRDKHLVRRERLLKKKREREILHSAKKENKQHIKKLMKKVKIKDAEEKKNKKIKQKELQKTLNQKRRQARLRRKEYLRLRKEHKKSLKRKKYNIHKKIILKNTSVKPSLEDERKKWNVDIQRKISNMVTVGGKHKKS